MTDPSGGSGKRVALLTYGTRGDVEPFVALAAGLRTAGFAVRVAAPGVFEPLARARAIEFDALPGDPGELAKGLVALAGTSWPRMVGAVSRFVAPIAARVYSRVLDSAADADVIVHTFLMTQAGHELALRMKVPSISAQLFPVFAPTAAFPAVVAPDLAGCGAYRRLTHAFVTQVFWQGSRLLYHRVRKEDPTLPPLSGWPFAGPRAARPRILFAFSRHVVPPPAEWRQVADVTGYWLLGVPEDWKAPVALERFLDDGPPPVYIGLGSAGEAAGAGWIGAAKRALMECGLRGVLGVGPGDPAPGDLPPSILAVGDVPHAWLFPRVAAVVHHGGAGTTGAGLAAGRPTIVVPTTADQPFWGRRVHALGAGPRPIPLRRLTPRALAEAIDAASASATMQARAAELGRRIRTEGGVAQAIACISRVLGI